MIYYDHLLTISMIFLPKSEWQLPAPSMDFLTVMHV